MHFVNKALEDLSNFWPFNINSVLIKMSSDNDHVMALICLKVRKLVSGKLTFEKKMYD